MDSRLAPPPSIRYRHGPQFECRATTGSSGAVALATNLWEEQVILNCGGPGGFSPMARLLMRDGQLYGTATAGGAFQVGTVFRLGEPANPTPEWTSSVLTTFPTGHQAVGPQTSVSFDNNGRLYGTTYGYDRYSGGTV